MLTLKDMALCTLAAAALWGLALAAFIPFLRLLDAIRYGGLL